MLRTNPTFNEVIHCQTILGANITKNEFVSMITMHQTQTLTHAQHDCPLWHAISYNKQILQSRRKLCVSKYISIRHLVDVSQVNALSG